MTIAAILRTKGSDVQTVSEAMRIADIVNLLCVKRIGAVVVTDDQDRILGVLSERDVMRGLNQYGCDVLEHTARSIMTAPVVTCKPHDTVQYAMEQMTNRRIRHLPVLERERLIGIVSIGDLVKRRIEDAEHEAEALKSYIATG